VKKTGRKLARKPRFDKRKSFIYCITLSTYDLFWKKYDSMEKAFYELVKEIRLILDALKKWARAREIVYKIELWAVLAKDKEGRYLPHAHGFICGDSKQIVSYICDQWTDRELGYGRFITKADGHKQTGNVHIQAIDDSREYGGKHGVAGWRKYSTYQQDKIKIGEEVGTYQGRKLRQRIQGHSTNGREYLTGETWEHLHEIDLRGDLRSFIRLIRPAVKR
jgi:hypothetical protein